LAMDLDFENLNINCKRAAFSIGPYIELTLTKKTFQAMWSTPSSICLVAKKKVARSVLAF
ncbi:hypothetical protein, partial [Piscirickettsia salmonis]|uniref:hypothetical protein n=1 Tax=Piscirickettsia salmonis TaxID=1238 RepID=UPI001E44E24E